MTNEDTRTRARTPYGTVDSCSWLPHATASSRPYLKEGYLPIKSGTKMEIGVKTAGLTEVHIEGVIEVRNLLLGAVQQSITAHCLGRRGEWGVLLHAWNEKKEEEQLNSNDTIQPLSR